jgi:hypothetical protein
MNPAIGADQSEALTATQTIDSLSGIGAISRNSNRNRSKTRAASKR